MASWQARLARTLVRRRVRPVLGDMSDLARVRRIFDRPLPSPAGVHYRPDTVGGVPGEWVEDAQAVDADARPWMLYVHGGGFVGCTARTHRPITAGFARRGFRVFAPDYRLAPEHRHPAALDDVRAAWRGLQALDAARPRRGRLVVAGDSAGGNLALALVHALRDEGAPLPDAMALFSPSADLTGGSASLLANTGRDPMFHGPALEHLVHAYLGADGDRAHPLVSPVLGRLEGFPPMLVHVGADEVLRDDGLRVAEKARAAGVHVEATVWPVVPHGWQLLAQLPEARRSLDRAAAFLATAPRPAADGAADARPIEHLDSVIIGAGLSGIGAAVRLQHDFPGRRFAILEARQAIGGTWDLFRYPGVRSDSDMYTLGYPFRPWTDARALADGATIRRYIVDTAVEHGLERQVRFGQRVVRADWSSADACWTLEIEHADAGADAAAPRRSRLRCDFLHACCGYYRYDAGHAPEFAGRADFRGRIVHPQHWPPDLDTAGKRIVVIGSGATAVTLVPELARTAAHVTMLQRSPGYVLALPAVDRVAGALARVLPRRWAYRLARAKNIAVGMLFFQLSRRWPAPVARRLVDLVRAALGPGHDVDTHFTPRYGPWDQRVCFAPDGDLFEAIRSGRAEVATDAVERFTASGLRLASGRELEADIVVTATGLALNVLGDVAVSVDGVAQDLSQAFAYKALMLSGVPNLVYTFGYSNASWTLKADLTARWTTRLLRHMQARGWQVATPVCPPGMAARPFLDLSSGYVQRAAAILPRQGTRAPWRLAQNYLVDLVALRLGRIADGTLRFARAGDLGAGPRGR
jgi:cation diffusion facilitator CzcD-associated flavoprotein CzcO/acetyl esterase/lipase